MALFLRHSLSDEASTLTARVYKVVATIAETYVFVYLGMAFRRVPHLHQRRLAPGARGASSWATLKRWQSIAIRAIFAIEPDELEDIMKEIEAASTTSALTQPCHGRGRLIVLIVLYALLAAAERPSIQLPTSRSSSDRFLSAAAPPKTSITPVRSLIDLSVEHRQKLTVTTVGLALFNDVLLLLMLVPMLPSLLDGQPDEMRVACLFSAKDVCQMLAAPFAGWLTLQAGASVSLGASLLGLAASTVAFAEARGFRSLLLARALQGATSAALMSGGLTLIAQTHAATERGAAIARAHSGLGLGAALGPVLGGLLFDAIGRRATFYAAAALVLLTACAQLLLSLAAPAPLVAAPSEAQRAEPPLCQLMTLLRTRDVALAAAGTFAIYAAGGLFDATFGLHLSEAFGFGPAATSLAFSVEPLTYLAMLLALAPITSAGHRFWTKGRLSAIGVALTGLSLPLLTLGGRMGTVLAATVVHGVGYACKDAVGHGLLADLVDKHHVGSYAMSFSLADVADSAGYILGPLLGLSLCRLLRSRTAGLLVVGLACAMLASGLLSIRVPSEGG